ncbi:small subunit ribosomal protein S3Ae [Enteropsectra breve]|nr:small subunit ribosomal protein S3Ae [Enteropsectra breve]
MAIRAPGAYVSKNKSAKKNKSRQKENRFSKKKFFNLTTKSVFPTTTHGKTCNTRVRARQDLTPFMIGRTFSVNQGDLNGDNRDTHRNFSFKVGEVKGNDCVSYFNGMYVSQDRVSGLVKKWHTLVEAYIDLKTKEGSTWRFFVSAVTKRLPGHTGKTCYAKLSEVKAMRKIMFEVLKTEVEGQDVDKVVKKLTTEAIGKLIEERCSEIMPVNAIVRKVKPVKNMKIIELAGKVGSPVAEDESVRVEILADN